MPHVCEPPNREPLHRLLNGGLDMAVNEHYGAQTVWTSDIDPGACKIIAHHYPDIPNLGDITAVDWSRVEPVDILTGGYPCQPFSAAGNRKGEDDERHLWPFVRQAIRHLRPRYTVLENVAGHRSLGFDRVLGDLAEDGMHVRWTSIRASDVGAPHGRERVFIVVADQSQIRQQGRRWSTWNWRPGSSVRHREVASNVTPHGLSGLPDTSGSAPARGSWERDAAGNSGVSPSADLASERRREGRAQSARLPRRPDADECRAQDWGIYERAIRRWERILGRVAPRPVERTAKGTRRLSPFFDEWFMGLPEGYICDAPDISWNEALAACGNGVVPQQALAALRVVDSLEAAA